MINEGESNRTLPKMFPCKTYKWHKKSTTHWFNQKRTWHSVLKVDAYADGNHKIILSCPYISTYDMCWSTINDLGIVKYFLANLCWFQCKYKSISNTLGNV